MADKMRLYAGDEDVDLEELERALTIVRRKMADPAAFPGFLENPEVSTFCVLACLLAKIVVGCCCRCSLSVDATVVIIPVTHCTVDAGGAQQNHLL